MAKRNLLLEYSEELAIKILRLCAEYKIDSNTVFQIKKSSSSVFANITEAQYPQSLADMHSKLEIARKECAETESWLKLIFASGVIDEETFKSHRNLCGRIKRMLTASHYNRKQIKARLNGLAFLCSEATPTCIKLGTLLGANRLTLDEKYGVMNSPINENLSSISIFFASLTKVYERGTIELYAGEMCPDVI